MLHKRITIFIIVFFISGCYTSHEITSTSELNKPDDIGNLILITKDSTMYKFSKFSLIDSAITGVANIETSRERKTAQCTIPCSDIRYIQSENFNFLLTLFSTAAIAYIGVSMVSNTSQGEIFKAGPHFQYPTGNSCPFIYVWDGHKFKLSAEAFGVGFGKALEMNSSSVLPGFSSPEDTIKIKVTNERPETHYFNSLNLKAVETDSTGFVIEDAENNFWSVSNFISPVCASDIAGESVLNETGVLDGQYWKSNISPDVSQSGYMDEIKFSFSPHDSVNSIVITSINTPLIFGLFNNLFNFLEDQSLRFMQAVETDSSLINSLKGWIREGSIKAYLLDGKNWVYCGLIYPEATVTPFTRLIRLKMPEIQSDTLKIKLEFLKGVVDIDAVQLGFSTEKPLLPKPVELISAVDFQNNDIKETILLADKNYKVLFPGQYFQAEFKSLQPSAGKKITYALNTQGYLYEWFPRKKTESPVAFTNETDKLALIIKMIEQKKILLPYIYSGQNFK